MNGRTHEAVGVATSMAIMHSAGTKEMVVGCLVALYASTIPDVDLIDNRKGTGIQMVVEVVKQSMIPIGISMYYRAEKQLIVAWIVLMIALVLQPHRGISHSLDMCAVLSAMFTNMTEYALLPWFLIAYMSHILIDLMNTKSVQILICYKTCFGWCKSGGVCDWAIGLVASIAILVMVALRINGIDAVQEILLGVKNMGF